MRNDTVRLALDELAGRQLCNDCAGAFLAVLDSVRAQRDDQPAVVPLPRDGTVPIPVSMLTELRSGIRPAGLTG